MKINVPIVVVAVCLFSSWALALESDGGGGDLLITGVRPIQVDYPSETGEEGGEVIVFWEIDEPFQQIRLLVDGGDPLRVLDGDATTVSLGRLSPGSHQVTVQGMISGNVAATSSASLDVLDAPLISGVESEGCLFYGWEPDEGGFLEFFWKNHDSPESPYVDFGISLNGNFMGILPAPADRLRFAGAPLGAHTLEVVAYTFNHICTPLVIDCKAEEVNPVLDPACKLEFCEEGRSVFRIDYTLPPGPPLDGVDAFDVTEGEAGFFLGTFPPNPPIRISISEPGELAIELSAFRGDSASIIPAVPGGHHVVATCSSTGDECSEVQFLRGDCDGNLEIDLTDEIFLLAHLFIGGEQPGCPAACDVDGGGELDLSDVIAALAFQFQGGEPPRPPFPLCGPDPGGGGLDCPRFPACGD